MVVESVQVRQLSANAAGEVTALAHECASAYGSVSHPELVRRLPQLADRLGAQVRTECRPPDPAHGLFVLRGLSVDDAAIGATPRHWSVASPQQTAEWDITLALLAAVMGRPFGWQGQQDSRLVHNILPSPGHEQEQTGASSTVLLSPHTEDAFHPQRADLMLLACLRNHDGVATHAATVRDIELSAAETELLSRPVLPILPDDSYTAHAAETQGQQEDSPAVHALWSTPDGLCARFDPAYTPLERADEAYRAAYERLGEELRRVSTSVRLDAGDVLVIDNDAVVHGREPFKARYDGTDRWLKRVSVRVPGRVRPASEADEHGYGQRIVDPCS